LLLLERADWLERFRQENGELKQELHSLKTAKPAASPAAPVPTRLDAEETLRSVPALRPNTEAHWIAVDEAGFEVLELIQRAAETEIAVLLLGESGTGKELLARTLHRCSTRHSGPFVAVNVASLTPELVASELFGHTQGAFTGARGARKGLVQEAHGGTLFLDEVGDMPAPVQPVLLRFLEDGLVRPIGANRAQPVDVRIVCATHHDLASSIAHGRFRRDLFHRLAGVRVDLPPLRDRPGDLQALVQVFLDQFADGRFKSLPSSWWPAFRSYSWPGNVRELRNAIGSVAVLSRGDTPEARFLPSPLRETVETAAELPPANSEFDGWTLAEVEREMIRRCLQRTGGHRGRAAKQLGISPRSLYDRLRRLELEP